MLAISPYAKRGHISRDHTSIMSIIRTIYLTFGLASRADHIALPGAGGAQWGVVIDLSRALADSEASAPADQIKSLDWHARQARKFDQVSDETLAEVLGKIGALVGWSADR